MSQAAVSFVRGKKLTNLLILGSRAMSSGEYGSGAGKGGGTGGSIRDAGGAFGKMEAAHEEQYMRKLQAEQLKALKKSLKIEEEFHKEQIDAHKKALERHRERLEQLHETEKASKRKDDD